MAAARRQALAAPCAHFRGGARRVLVREQHGTGRDRRARPERRTALAAARRKPRRLATLYISGGAMAGRLKDKVAIVTGAGSRGPGLGNGKATAILFAREGARVLCVDAELGRAEETVKEIDR